MDKSMICTIKGKNIYIFDIFGDGGLGFSRIKTVKVIWSCSSFSGGRRMRVPFHTLFQA
jgi:hypothetical protein